MDHDDVRELLEDAAIDPGGLERLMAGDTPAAALVAGHLAACPDCAEELARLHRAVGLIRPVVRSLPPPELKARTLAHIAAVGRPRGTHVMPTAPEPEHPPIAPGGVVTTVRPAAAFTGSSRMRALAGLAAALIVAVAATGLVVNANRDADARLQAAQIEALGDVARWTLRVDGQPDVRRIALASATGGATTGSLVFSPSSTELVVVAGQLPPPPAGHEYRCWLEVEGTRSGIGRMFFGGDLAYWVGPVPKVAGLGQGARFGVSLVDLAAKDGLGIPVLVSN